MNAVIKKILLLALAGTACENLDTFHFVKTDGSKHFLCFWINEDLWNVKLGGCLLYTSPSPRD